MFRPKFLINIFLINSHNDKLLFVKKNNSNFYELIGEILDFGEEFDQCIQRVLYDEAQLEVDNERVKRICSYNCVDKIKNKHFVTMTFYLQLTADEEKNSIGIDLYKYQDYRWMSIDEVFKYIDELFFGIKIFFEKYKIKTIDDIKNLIAN